jgi:glycosyltransferase involved in cell wall biosynthesis
MKIAIVYDMIYPFNIGGAELRNYQIAKQLSQHHDVHMYGVKLWAGPDVITIDGVTIHGVCHYSDRYKFSGSRTIFQSFKFGIMLYFHLFRKKFDIIDVSAFAYMHCFTSRLAAAYYKTPVVFTWHQYWGDYWYSYLGRVKGFFGSLVEKSVKYLSRYHIAVSQATKRDLVKSGVQENNIFVNYCGVDIPAIERLPEQDKVYDIIFVGRLTHQKNVELLVEAVGLLKKDLPNISACIVGDGPLKDQLIYQVNKFGLGSNIVFKGFIASRDDVFLQMKQSKVFVLPSLLEGFGMVVAEAMACGLPAIVVKSQWNASLDLVVDGANGLLSDNSPTDLAKQIKKILTDDSLLDHMSTSSRQRSQSFNWTGVIDRLEKYYLQVIKDAN